MTQNASGTFAVKLGHQPPHDTADGVSLARASLRKEFAGELTGTAQGEMLSAVTATAGSAGYVAIERVQATLQGRSGSFVLQHSGIMNRGQGQLSVHVVPDSGTGELRGLSGTMKIEIVSGKHLYSFDYTLG